MTHINPNIVGKSFPLGRRLSFQAVAESEIESLFDVEEDCANTTVSVLVSLDGEQVATIEKNAYFYFSEGYEARSDRWSADAFHFLLDDERISLAAHDWDPTETTSEEVDALEDGYRSHFWAQANRAAADVCLQLETTIREMRRKDMAETVNFPVWAASYVEYGDPSALSEEDLSAVDEWVEGLERPGFSYVIDYGDPEADPYFSSNPAFGMPGDCVRATISYFPERR